jgi:hypothetical protein
VLVGRLLNPRNTCWSTLFDDDRSVPLVPNIYTVVACDEGGNTVSRETSLELRMGLLENEVERLRLQLIVLTKALAKVIRILKRL